MVRLRPLVALGALLLLSLALISCGDDKADNAAASPDGLGPTQGGQVTTINLAESTAKLSSLKSFRFEINANIDIDLPASTMTMDEEESLGYEFAALLLGFLKDVKVEGAVVAPDQFEMKMTVAGQDFGFVKIADKAWMQTGGVWTPVDSDEFSFSFDEFDLDELTIGMVPQEVVQAAKVTKERVGGVDTTRYSFDKAAIQSFAGHGDMDEVDAAQLDVWLTADGIPLKMAAEMSGHATDGEEASMTFDMQLSDINSDIKIKAPM
jgi:hypothetical protein